MNATATATRKPAAAVHGTCRWIARPDANGLGRCLIRTDAGVSIEYTLGMVRNQPGRVILVHDEASYLVDTEAGTCECEDFKRGRRPDGLCKHVKAVRKLLAALEVPAEPAGCTNCRHHAASRQPCLRPECQGF
jgi:hypothetical protein